MLTPLCERPGPPLRRRASDRMCHNLPKLLIKTNFVKIFKYQLRINRTILDFATKQQKIYLVDPHKIHSASERCYRAPALSESLRGAYLFSLIRIILTNTRLSWIRWLAFWGVDRQTNRHTDCVTDRLSKPGVRFKEREKTIVMIVLY